MLAERFIPKIEKTVGIKTCLDGKISSLLYSMEKSYIQSSIVLSIATKPVQFESIFDWSKQIASQKLIPFASVHPDDQQILKHIDMISKAGIKGIKLHPYYQDFIFDEQRMFPVYERIQQSGLVLLAHTGFDIAYERKRIADPEKILRVVETFPDLKLVTSHLGAWQDWDMVEKWLLGKPIYMEVSYSFKYLDVRRAKKILLSHPKEFILFGSDSPWGSQSETLKALLDMKLGHTRTESILYNNAHLLLHKG